MGHTLPIFFCPWPVDRRAPTHWDDDLDLLNELAEDLAAEGSAFVHCAQSRNGWHLARLAELSAGALDLRRPEVRVLQREELTSAQQRLAELHRRLESSPDWTDALALARYSRNTEVTGDCGIAGDADLLSFLSALQRCIARALETSGAMLWLICQA